MTATRMRPTTHCILKLATKIALVLATTLLLVVFAFLLIVSQLDPNRHKSKIEDFVKTRTGYAVRFEGPIQVTWFPVIRLEAEKMSLINPPDFQQQPFVGIEKSEIQVKWLPLFHKKIEMKDFVIEGLTVNLATNQQGLLNWDVFRQQSRPLSPVGQANVFPIPPTFSLDALSITNFRINWRDQQTKKRLTLKDLKLNAKQLAFGSPIAVDLAMAVEGDAMPISGTLTLTTDLLVDKTFDRIDLKKSHAEWVGADLMPSGSVHTGLLSIVNTEINIPLQTARLSGLELESGHINMFAEMKAEQLKDNPTLAGSIRIAPFNPRLALTEWGFATPDLNDPKAMAELGGKFCYKVTANQAAFSNISIVLDNSRLAGALTVKDFKHPGVTFDMAIDTIDTDRYLLKSAKSKGEKKNSQSHFDTKTIVAGLDWLKQLNAEGELAVGNLLFNKTTFRDLRLRVHSKQGMLKVDQSVQPKSPKPIQQSGLGVQIGCDQ